MYAYVPRIERHFDSPLHQPESAALVHQGWIDLMAGLTAGRLPYVRLDFEGQGWSHDGGAALGRKVVVDALEGGYAAALIVADDDAYMYADIARTELIGDTIDLAALRHDIEAWLRAAGVWDGQAAAEVDQAMSVLAGTRYSQYLNKTTDLSTFDLDSGIVHAIVTGDHPATAIAFYLKNLLDEDWYWHNHDESPPVPPLPPV